MPRAVLMSGAEDEQDLVAVLVFLMCFGLSAGMKPNRLVPRLGKQHLLPGLCEGTSSAVPWR